MIYLSHVVAHNLLNARGKKPRPFWSLYRTIYRYILWTRFEGGPIKWVMDFFSVRSCHFTHKPLVYPGLSHCLYLHVIQRKIWEIYINDICTSQLTEPRLGSQKEYWGENSTLKGPWIYLDIYFKIPWIIRKSLYVKIYILERVPLQVSLAS